MTATKYSLSSVGLRTLQSMQGRSSLPLTGPSLRFTGNDDAALLVSICMPQTREKTRHPPGCNTNVTDVIYLLLLFRAHIGISFLQSNLCCSRHSCEHSNIAKAETQGRLLGSMKRYLKGGLLMLNTCLPHVLWKSLRLQRHANKVALSRTLLRVQLAMLHLQYNT